MTYTRWILIGLVAIGFATSPAFAQPNFDPTGARFATYADNNRNVDEENYEVIVKHLSTEAMSVAAKLCRSGRYDEAEFLLNKVVHMDPDNGAAREALAIIGRTRQQEAARPVAPPQPPAPSPFAIQATGYAQPVPCPNGQCPVPSVQPGVRVAQTPTTSAVAPCCAPVNCQHCASCEKCCCNKSTVANGSCCCSGKACCNATVRVSNGCSCCGNTCCCGQRLRTVNACQCANVSVVRGCCGCGQNPGQGTVVYRVIEAMPRGIPVCTISANGTVVFGKPAVTAVRPQTRVYVHAVSGVSPQQYATVASEFVTTQATPAVRVIRNVTATPATAKPAPYQYYIIGDRTASCPVAQCPVSYAPAETVQVYQSAVQEIRPGTAKGYSARTQGHVFYINR